MLISQDFVVNNSREAKKPHFISVAPVRTTDNSTNDHDFKSFMLTERSQILVTPNEKY